MRFIPKPLLTYLVILGLLIPLALLVFVLFAIRPGLSPDQFPAGKIVNFSVSEKLPAPSSSSSIKVVTFNVGYASGDKNNLGSVLKISQVKDNLVEIVDKIKEINPDLLLLQEVDFYSSRSFEINQFKYLADELRMPFGAYYVNWNKRYVAWPLWPPKNHFGRIVSGQAVLSRFPILEQRVTVFPKPESNPFWYNWFYLNRAIQHLKIQLPHRVGSLYNLHLEAFAKKTRAHQINFLSTLIKEDPNPVKIVGGDFNQAWESKLQTAEEVKISKDLIHNFEKVTNLKMAGSNSAFYTFPSWDAHKGIDLIFYSQTFLADGFGVGKNLSGSDHLPAWVVLTERAPTP